MRLKLNIKDQNRIPDIINELDYLDNHKVQIGIFGEDDSTILMIARVHEFGVDIRVTQKMRAYLHYEGLHLKKSTQFIHIPERSYMRTAFDEQQQAIYKLISNGVERILMGEITGRQLLERLGIHLMSEVQDKMNTISSPANHPYTINKKGSSNPLIDTGRLKQAVTYKVV